MFGPCKLQGKFSNSCEAEFDEEGAHLRVTVADLETLVAWAKKQEPQVFFDEEPTEAELEQLRKKFFALKCELDAEPAQEIVDRVSETQLAIWVYEKRGHKAKVDSAGLAPPSTTSRVELRVERFDRRAIE